MTRSLRIAHVLPYVSADGAFGGPVAVAVEQCRELARQGHRVVLVAGWDGEVDLEVEGVDVRLYRVHAIPGLGFSGLLSPALLAGLRRHVREFDVVHIHLGRHLLALSAADVCRASGVPYVLQTHGMVIEDARPKSRVLDALAVRRVLRGAGSVLALTAAEADALAVVSRGEAEVTRIRNGIAASPVTRSAGNDGTPEVLFLARLHPRKRVLAFAQMAEELHGRGVDARFTVVGPDEGDLPVLRAFLSDRPQLPLEYRGSIAPGASAARLAQADVYVLPSVNEVFPMTVLEALSVGTPVVITEDCGISADLREAHAALVTAPDPRDLADAVERVLTSPDARALLARGMRESLADVFGISAVVGVLVARYADAIG